MKKFSKIIKKILIITIPICIFFAVVIFGINLYVVSSTSPDIFSAEESLQAKNPDCIIVLGCGVWGDRPSPMLEDRLKTAIWLYKAGLAPKIIMSGDHGTEEYDEVNVMKSYAIENGVPSEDIFMDHAGFSTYDTIYRAKEIFSVESAVIVTQKYHLHRALFICNKLGIDAFGVNSDPRQYSNQFYRELREIIARNKDFFMCIFKPEASILGDKIPVSGNGNVTND